MKSKLLSYAFPFSEIAIKNGFKATGCWFVELYPRVNAHFNGKPVPGSYTNHRPTAVAFIENMPEPYNCQQVIAVGAKTP
jgi:hypothetical protein